VHLTDFIYEKNESVAIAIINRPARLNAFRGHTYQELRDILQEARVDDAVRTLIITGSGRAFSAGEDLKDLSSILGDAPKLRDSLDSLKTLQDITRQIVNHPKIIIAAVNGLAVGFGSELAIASDIRIAAESASFAFAEVKRSLFVTNGVMYLLPRLVGHGRALEYMLTGEPVPAREALDAGLVNRLVPDGQLMERALEMARTIGSNAPISVRLLKQYMRRSGDLDLDGAMQLEIDGMLECLASEDLVEGTRAFIEGRKPKYQGR
jgi:enoyl-CoA hydratase/carnithine racemase